MNLQELIKKHNLKVGDEVVCVGLKLYCNRKAYEVGKIYRIELTKANEFCINGSYTGLNGIFELPYEQPKKHKHCELIKAWADGAVIEWYSKDSEEWKFCANNSPSWGSTIKYRMKPDNTEEIAQLEDQIHDLKARVIKLKE